ncbi:hypothetical protein [Microbacterium album]|uniref:Uncharacterized protein n=1 Tax=Microbacterium album TaxID=2053191 RepID=A0A917IEP6_9MICO|nr:hypothetical protein [Microbacterium album]GGH36443.1 hypothetical protein GCM10010921_05600 [Microbacterium album]
MRPLDAAECIDRARVHAAAAANIEGEWSAVAYFYAAYHLVRHALQSDPVFADLNRLKSYDSNLVPDDRSVTVHQARRGAGVKTFGVNDLVRILYPDITPEYLALHELSVAVRYGRGISASDLDDARRAYEAIRAAIESGLAAA